MTPFLLISRSIEYESKLRDLLGARLSVVTGELLTLGPESVLKQVTSEPRVALLGPVLSFEETRELARGLTERNPGIGLIVVREQRADLEDWVDALPIHAVLSPLASEEVTVELLNRLTDWLVGTGRASPDDFNAVELEQAPEVRNPVTQTAEEPVGGTGNQLSSDAVDNAPTEAGWLFPPLEPGERSEAIAVVAPKGGQGKSTLSINLAVGLAELAPNSVVLVDGDLQFGDVSVALALEATHSIVDAVAPEAADELVLKTTFTHHPAGFFVVASAPSPELGDAVQPRELGQLITRLRGIFRYVVVDSTPGLGEHTLHVLEHVTDAVFVSNMAVSSLRALRAELTMLTTLGLMPANRHVVLNFSDRMAGLTTKDAAAIIGAPIDLEIPRSPAVVLASNRGRPLIHDEPRDPASRALRGLIARIAREEQPKRKRGLRKGRILEPQ
ncbi:AAA family ATPase [Agromyces indicus]|uniref:P-loop NTPase n=1 Tax=Agromyces indicus TaxID=758919 RepID=A0ABU1FH24_9MICO|nr:P-loop NTPase [Agromyces indicus]MDR5691040.1 P-loop NTPase [Agromyces indicus]